jgi:hypothetical protein
MAYLDEHKAKFENLKVSLDLQNRDQLKRKANGGNSIVFTYPPKEEILYLKKLNHVAQENNYHIIDLADLFTLFISKTSFGSIKRKYSIFKATPHKVFIPFKDLIIDTIKQVDNKIPVLTRTGTLYGTGIENVNIMEDTIVMNLNNPLIIFYPGKIENDSLYFLNIKPASKYRCTVI